MEGDLDWRTGVFLTWKPEDPAHRKNDWEN
jgi:hypothetical protein